MAGTIGASVTAAHIPPLWLEFSLYILLAGTGIYMNRKNPFKTNKTEESRVDSLNRFKELIDEQLELISHLIKDDNVKKGLLNNGQIEHLYNDVEEIRVDMINQLGMKKYITIISPFAQAERLLYRGYSSAMDGYEHEAKQSISQSLEFFKITKQELNKA